MVTLKTDIAAEIAGGRAAERWPGRKVRGCRFLLGTANYRWVAVTAIVLLGGCVGGRQEWTDVDLTPAVPDLLAAPALPVDIVVDCSGGMVPVLTEVRREVAARIGRMPAAQSFQLHAFSGDDEEVFLGDGTDSRARAAEWAGDLGFGGTGLPDQALTDALRRRPAAIEFICGDRIARCGGPQLVRAVRDANPGRIPVDCVFIGNDPAAAELAREISSQSGGTFKPVARE